jgi:hypothetical protein
MSRMHILLLCLHPISVVSFSTAVYDSAANVQLLRVTTRSTASKLTFRKANIFRRHLSDEPSDGDTGETGPVTVISKPPMPEDSHEELMYALGVNLARQLGDVRPLVENGAELACVAKGLLDTVVGRFSEEGQVDLLKRRKEDLNSVILSRA